MWHSQKTACGFYPRDFELTCPAWAHALLSFKAPQVDSITDSIQSTQQFVIYSAQQEVFLLFQTSVVSEFWWLFK